MFFLLLFSLLTKMIENDSPVTTSTTKEEFKSRASLRVEQLLLFSYVENSYN